MRSLRACQISLSLIGLIVLTGQASGQLKWQQDEKSLSLLNSGKVVWRFNAEEGEMKPCFHPLATLDGTPLTAYEPKDHPWHRGAWFSFKYINGVNYWEEDGKTQLSPGRTRVEAVTFTPNEDFSAKLEFTLGYSPPGKPELIHEQRVLMVSAPDQDKNYRIDWQMSFTARQDVTLQRTPLPGEPEGKPYGGYAGLSVRMAPMLAAGTAINSGGQRGEQVHGQTANWISLSQPSGGISVFDHPGNPTFPTAFYYNAQMPFFSPSILFHKSMELKKDEILNLSYRILVSSKAPTTADLNAEFDSFKKLPIGISTPGMINLVELGHQTYASLCEACHSTDLPGKDFKTGPTWWALSGIKPRARKIQANGVFKEIITDDGYLQRAIITPNAELAVHENGDQKGAAYLPIMPDYSHLLRPQEIDAVIAYIKTLNPENNRGPEEVWQTDTKPKKDARSPTDPNHIRVGTEAIVQRAIIDGETTRTFAVGMPDGYRYLFDPASCSVTQAWRGGFLDLSGERTARGTGPNEIDEPIYFGFSPFLKPLGKVRYKGYQLVKGGEPRILMEIDGDRIAQTVRFENDQMIVNIARLGDGKAALRFEIDHRQLSSLQTGPTKVNGEQLTIEPSQKAVTLRAAFLP